MTEADVIQPSASIASTGKGIRYIGNHCYAYAGVFNATTSDVTVLNFTTGSGIIVGEVQFNAPFNPSTVITGKTAALTVKFNGQIIAALKATGDVETMPAMVTSQLIIPPQTEVLMTIISHGSDDSRKATITFTGRVYGAD